MTELPANSLSVDLSRLPAPEFVAPLSFEAILADRLADFRVRAPQFDALVESDPAMKLIENGAYRELLMRGAINDAGRAVMLAYATGGDLDQIGARFGVTRRILTAATPTAPAVLESDETLRERVRLAPERFAGPGLTAGSYRAIALATEPSLRDVGLVKRGGGRIDVVLLGREGDGTVDSATVARVDMALNAEDGAQLTDIVHARSAQVIRYSPVVTLHIRPGPDPALIAAAAERSVRAYAEQRWRVDRPVYAGMLAAAAAIGGVDRALVDLVDIDPGAFGAAWLEELTIVTEIVR